MKCLVQIIGTDTVDLTPSLLLVCDNKRYLFNAGEGTQRLCLEHYVRMGQIDAVLFTRLSWEEIGGLPGLVLTTSDTGMKALTVCGPPGTQDFITSTRYFLQRNDFFMEIKEFQGDQPAPFVDQYMRIYPIVLDPSKLQEVRYKEEMVGSAVGGEELRDDSSYEYDESEEEQTKGIAYIPSARKNQKLNILKENVSQVVSLMFSKHRQLSEYEELSGAANFEYYDTSYARAYSSNKLKKRSAKNAFRKNETLNFERETQKMRLACNDPKLLVHGDFFGAHPDVGTYESDTDPETIINAINADVASRVPSTHSTKPVAATNADKGPESKRQEKKTVSEVREAKFPLTSGFTALSNTPKEGTVAPTILSFPSTTSSFPSLFGSTKPTTFSSAFSTTASSFGSASPFSFPTISFNLQTTPSPAPSFTSLSTADAFGKVGSEAPIDVASLFGKPALKFDQQISIGNESLFSEPAAEREQPVEEEITQEPIRDTEKQSQIVLCYACHMKDVIRLDYEKAHQLGVPPGPLIAELREGKTVKSETTGLDVRPQDCFADPIPGPAFLVIHCPSISYMPLITRNKAFEQYFHSMEFVIHLTHHDALQTEEYKNWMHKFDTLEHIIINKEVCPHHYVCPTAAAHQHKMNLLSKDIFPLPYYRESTAIVPNKCNCGCGAELVTPVKDPRDMSGLPENTSIGEVFMQFVLYPEIQRGLDKADVMRGSIAKCLVASHRLNEISELPAATAKLNEFIRAQNSSKAPQPYPRLLFLGTASALPSKYRNVSGIFFEVKRGSSMLIDAGEGSYGQLYRRFGEQVDEALATIKLVWISHIHADHHLGLIRILLKRKEQNITTPLMVVAPRPVGRWLAEFDQTVQSLNYDFVDCADLTTPRNYMRTFFETTFGFQDVTTLEVVHCAEAYGLIIIHNDGWKLVVSGDTRPCHKLEELGKDAFLLIHEATLESGQEKDAHEKGHCTTRQAISSCEKMNAKWVILTHFSQRYPSIPKLPEGAELKTGIAYDLMDISWSDIPVLPQLLHPMSLILHYEEQARAVSAQRTREFYAQLETQNIRERARAKRVKFRFDGEDEEEDEKEEEECQKRGVYYNRFARGRGKGRGFYVDPTKKRGKVDR